MKSLPYKLLVYLVSSVKPLGQGSHYVLQKAIAHACWQMGAFILVYHALASLQTNFFTALLCHPVHSWRSLQNCSCFQSMHPIDRHTCILNGSPPQSVYWKLYVLTWNCLCTGTNPIHPRYSWYNYYTLRYSKPIQSTSFHFKGGRNLIKWVILLKSFVL